MSTLSFHRSGQSKGGSNLSGKISGHSGAEYKSASAIDKKVSQKPAATNECSHAGQRLPAGMNNRQRLQSCFGRQPTSLGTANTRGMRLVHDQIGIVLSCQARDFR